MPRKSGSKSDTTYQVKFINCELDKATKEAVKKWDPKFEATFDALDRLTIDGYKWSVSPDTYHDCVGAFLTMPKLDHPNHGFCLSARGPNWLNAVKVLVYKHFQILGEHWDTEVNQERSRDEWG